MIPGIEIIRPKVLTRLVEELRDRRTTPAAYWFLNRTPKVPSEDWEILGRQRILGHIADIITNDAEARVYRYGQFSRFENTIPNIKHGYSINEDDTRRLLEARNRAGGGPLPDWVGRTIATMFNQLMDDHEARWESLLIGAVLDDFSYNRMGMIFSAVWGVPADLKTVVSPAWTDHTNADPVRDIQVARELRDVKYGWPTNQLLMSRQAFREMIQTEKYIAAAQATLPAQITYADIVPVPNDRQLSIARGVLEVDEIVFYDARFWQDDGKGNKTSVRRWPIDKVLLRDTSIDNNANALYLAEAKTTESILGPAIASNGVGTGEFAEGTYGFYPYTHVPANMNPPSITGYGVSRAFSVRPDRACMSWLDVGTLTDAIAVVDEPL